MLIKWNDKYSVHNEALDNDHKKLFFLAEKVYYLDPHQATKANIRELLMEFFTYMKKHFKDEEKYMQDIGYPRLDEHKIQHQEIIDDMTNILKESFSFLDIRTMIKTVVKRWLIEHIIKDDKDYEIWHDDTLDVSKKKEYKKYFK